MIEPVKLADFFTVFFSAASVILFGASYALLFAWSRVRHRPRLMPLAYAAYAGLFVSVIVLAFAANLFNNTFLDRHRDAHADRLSARAPRHLAPLRRHPCRRTEMAGPDAPGTAPAKFFQQR
jgi:glucan phosphoethanolaminetransferase (alkaline phosphatase superfamily)